MSFADPLSLTVNAVTTPLPRTSVEGDETEYTSADGNLKVRISHDYGKTRTRRMLRVDATKIAPDEFKSAENVKRSMSIYMVFDLPSTGYSPDEAYKLFQGYNFLVGSAGIVTKLLAGES